MSQPPLSLESIPTTLAATVPYISPSETRRFFWTNSRSLSFASMGFKSEDRQLVEHVYAFCRITDDIVDEAGDVSRGEIKQRLDAWLETARASYRGEEAGIEWLDELMAESSRREVPFGLIESLVHGVGLDACLTQIETVEELRLYCYGVASVVGLWLCHLFGVTDPWFLERSEALGRGMQLTNIIRDVGEDLRRGRVYIPVELLEEHGVSPHDLERALTNGDVPPGYESLMDELIDMAERDYRLAWEAIPRLDGGFARASAVAAEVYRAIHFSVVANGYNNFTERGRTTDPGKVLLMVRALFRLWTGPASDL